MNWLKPNTMNYLILIAILMLTLSGCGTVQVEETCPTVPKPPAKVQMGPTFQPRMQNFLQGNLPEATGLEQPLKPATTTRTQ